jgi:hypothetical protein
VSWRIVKFRRFLRIEMDLRDEGGVKIAVETAMDKAFGRIEKCRADEKAPQERNAKARNGSPG